MIRVGRYTAALLLLAVGIALLMDQTRGTAYLSEWIRYWPVLLITLGVEYLVAGFRARSGERKVKWDIGAMVGAVLIAAAVSVLFQGSSLKQLQWNLSFDRISILGYGRQYEKAPEWVDLPEETEKLVVRNENGDITLTTGTGDRIEIRATVLLYNQSAAKAEKLVQESKVLVTPGSTLVIEPQGAEYAPFFARQKARMNLVVMLPADRALDVELETKNGDIAAEAVAIDDMFLASTLNGDIAVRDLNGLVDVKTENGDVELRRIGGPVRVKTLNGEIEVEDVAGNAVLETSNGDVEALFVRGSVEAETRNGDVKLTEIPEAVMVKTYNGDIEVSTSRVGGDWVIETRNGTVELELPADGDYTVEADTIYGDVETNVPGLTTTKHRITGVVGTGEHLLNIATNSDIDIVAKPGY